MDEKIALKGLRGARAFKVTKNDEKNYAIGEKTDLKAAQGLTKNVETEDYEIPADDTIYDSGTDFKSETIELTVAELPLSVEASLSGATHDEEKDVYHFSNLDVAPEFAVGYAALRLNKTYRMFMHPVTKLTSVQVEHKTKGNTNEVASYKLAFKSVARKCDGEYRLVKDSTDATYKWLDTVEAITLT